MPHPIAAPINHKALSQRARDIRAWLGGFLKWALRELSRPGALIPRLLIDGAPALRVAERELRELILCEALSRFSCERRHSGRAERDPESRGNQRGCRSWIPGSASPPRNDELDVVQGSTRRDASVRSRARPRRIFDARHAPRGFRFSRVRMSATRQLTRGVLPTLRETTPYARAERLARVSEKIEFYANALLARLCRGARACSFIMIAPPAREFCANAPRPARATADTS